MSELKNKRVISVALTGSWPSKKDNPNLPITPEEIAQSAIKCWEAGAAVAHIHVRNDDGSPGMGFEKYKKVVDLIRAHKDCDINLNLTTSGTVDAEDETRIYPLEQLLPEMASYDCGSMNWMHNTIFENHPRFLEKLGKATQELGVKPEIEIFDTGMMHNAAYYVKKGILKAPCHFQFVLGAAGGMDLDLNNLMYLYNMLPENCTWAACGIGKGHMPVMLATIALGGHLRVGMEDNVFYHRGVLADSNEQFVARAARLLVEANYEVATPEEARQILGLRQRK